MSDLPHDAFIPATDSTSSTAAPWLAPPATTGFTPGMWVALVAMILVFCALAYATHRVVTRTSDLNAPGSWSVALIVVAALAAVIGTFA